MRKDLGPTIGVLLPLVALALILGAVSLAQTRSLPFDSAAVKVDSLQATPIGDGGYVVTMCAHIDPAQMGDPALSSCEVFPSVTGAPNVNRLDFLVGNFTPRWQGRQRFPVVAGAAP